MADTTATPPLKVAIVGTAPTSRFLAPFDDPTWQIWACSAANVGALPRVTLWFEMHMIAEMMAAENKAGSEPFYRWLKERSESGDFKVIMCETGSHYGGPNTMVPQAMPYPRDQMIETFGRNWFTSSVAYMMAFAIANGAKEIGLFGVDMAADQEHYEAQRAGCTRFIEIAEANGIKVHVPMESCLKTAAPMYGYWEGEPFGRRINATETLIKNNIAGINNQMQALRDQLQFFMGAQEQLRYFKRTWTDGSNIEIDFANFQQDIALQAKAEAPAADTGAETKPAEAPVPLPAFDLMPKHPLNEQT